MSGRIEWPTAGITGPGVWTLSRGAWLRGEADAHDADWIVESTIETADEAHACMRAPFRFALYHRRREQS